MNETDHGFSSDRQDINGIIKAEESFFAAHAHYSKD